MKVYISICGLWWYMVLYSTIFLKLVASETNLPRTIVRYLITADSPANAWLLVSHATNCT